MPDTQVVVITRNRLALLKQCMESVLQSDLGGAFLLVIDNGSSDGTIEYLEKITRIDKLVKNPSNIPQWQKAYALKQAYALFKPTDMKYFAWIDDDMVLQPAWLSKGKKILDARSEVIAASLHNDKRQEQKHPTKVIVTVGEDQVRLKRHANGPVWVVRRSFFDAYGLPPVTGRVDRESMSDRYYDKKLSKAPGKFIAVLDNMSVHLGYNISLRTILQGKTKRKKGMKI